MEPLTLLDRLLGSKQTGFESPLDIEACLSRLRDQLRPLQDPFDREGLDGVVGYSSGRVTRRYRSWLPSRASQTREVEVSMVFSDAGGETHVSCTTYLGLSTKIDLVVMGAMTILLTPVLLLVAWHVSEPYQRLVAAAMIPLLTLLCLLLRAEAFRERDSLLRLIGRLLDSAAPGMAAS